MEARIENEKATRASFGEALLKLGGEFPDIVVLDADLSKSTQSASFAKKFPDRFFQMGIQEANMIGAASGMAFDGKIPFLCSFGAFLTGRFDTIRVTVGYGEANIRLVGTHAGIGIGEDGTTQMALEDLACMQAIPGMSVFSPADDVETKALMRYLVSHRGPAYLRLTRQKVPQVFDDSYQFCYGKFTQVKRGKDAVLLTTGHQTGLGLEAANLLEKEGISLAVMNVCTIKPIDRKAIEHWIKQVPFIFTAEDHNVVGGLGSTVANVMAENISQARLVKIGIPDTFGESGSPDALYEKYALDAMGIARTVKSHLSLVS